MAPEVSRAPGDIENATEAPSRAKTGVLKNGTSEEPVGQNPPAGGALRLVRTYAPDERNQLKALRLLATDPSFVDPPLIDSSPTDDSL